jgi:NAD(P)-dependent dehydrogenase (short-subunit alcohol dehydrogenase family)
MRWRVRLLDCESNGKETEMKILVVGASGVIGSAVVAELGKRHDIVAAGRSASVRLDISDGASIKAAYEKIGRLDAVVVAAGSVKFAPLAQMHAADYEVGLMNKLMGQVNLVLIGRDYVREGGSFTLTSGILDSEFIRGGTSASMVNGGLNTFVMAAAIEMPRGQRINIVSPGVVAESQDDYESDFRGFETVPAARVARAFAKSVEGAQTGQVYRVV